MEYELPKVMAGAIESGLTSNEDSKYDIVSSEEVVIMFIEEMYGVRRWSMVDLGEQQMFFFVKI